MDTHDADNFAIETLARRGVKAIRGPDALYWSEYGQARTFKAMWYALGVMRLHVDNLATLKRGGSRLVCPVRPKSEVTIVPSEVRQTIEWMLADSLRGPGNEDGRPFDAVRGWDSWGYVWSVASDAAYRSVSA